MSRKALAVAVLAAGMTLAVGIGVSAAHFERFEAGNIVMLDHGGISPKTLPRHEAAPISAVLAAKVRTKDGTHPPAARTLTVDFDKTLHVDTRGLPSCSKEQLLARSTVAAKQACGDAIVGSGSAEAEVAFPEQLPFRAKGPLVAFNGGTRDGKTVIFVHAYINVPAPTAVVTETQLSPIDRGHYGLHSVTTIPPIAGGSGSLTAVTLHLGRQFTSQGKRRSFLSASCPTGHYFVEGHLAFSDGTLVHITHALPCTPTT